MQTRGNLMQSLGIFYGRLWLKKGCFTNDDDVTDQIKMDGMSWTCCGYEELNST
jgi:hypothetical protein